MTDCVTHNPRKVVGGVVCHPGRQGEGDQTMDIDAAVAELNVLVAANIDAEFVSDHDTARMMELWDGINKWMHKGGALPKVWARFPR